MVPGPAAVLVARGDSASFSSPSSPAIHRRANATFSSAVPSPLHPARTHQEQPPLPPLEPTGDGFPDETEGGPAGLNQSAGNVRFPAGAPATPLAARLLPGATSPALRSGLASPAPGAGLPAAASPRCSVAASSQRRGSWMESVLGMPFSRLPPLQTEPEPSRVSGFGAKELPRDSGL